MIKIPNSYMEGDKNQQGLLSPEELSVFYCIASLHNKFRNGTSTTINLLIEENPHFANNKRTHAKVKQILFSLHEKGVITLDKKPRSIHDRIFITFELPKDSYETIPFEYFIKTQTPEQFMILCITRRWNNYASHCQKAFTQWGRIMNIDERTAKSQIKKLESAGLLKVDHGEMTDKKRRKTNKYYVYDFERGEKVTKRKESKKESKQDDKSKYPENVGNWFNGGHIGEDDIYLYFLYREQYPEFRKHCEDVIERLKKTRFKDSLEKMIEKVKLEFYSKQNNQSGIETNEPFEPFISDDVDWMERYKQLKENQPDEENWFLED